jgi:hypothetical protein
MSNPYKRCARCNLLEGSGESECGAKNERGELVRVGEPATGAHYEATLACRDRQIANQQRSIRLVASQLEKLRAATGALTTAAAGVVDSVVELAGDLSDS